MGDRCWEDVEKKPTQRFSPEILGGSALVRLQLAVQTLIDWKRFTDFYSG